MGCFSVRYCDSTCQKQDWSKHKDQCHILRLIRDTEDALFFDEQFTRHALDRFGWATTCYIVQVAYSDDTEESNLESRNQLEDAARCAGFDVSDSSMSRFLVKPNGDVKKQFRRFFKQMNDAASARNIQIARMLFCLDPGLGICLKYCEDMPCDNLPKMIALHTMQMVQPGMNSLEDISIDRVLRVIRKVRGGETADKVQQQMIALRIDCENE